MQCTVKPSKRSHDNAIGIWFGLPLDSNEDENVKSKTWILGIDLKHLNSKNSIWDLNTKTNTVWNFNSGFHFGERPGMNTDVSYYIMTDDLVSKTNGNASQFYIGPSIGINYLNTNGKSCKFNPKLGATGGMLMLIPEFKHFPESDIAIEASMNFIDNILYKTKKEDLIGRFLYHMYVF
ncbi:hypothetical protein R83H12_01428 [Fibrobacteria bacterium R8-3-H12]